MRLSTYHFGLGLLCSMTLLFSTASAHVIGAKTKVIPQKKQPIDLAQVFNLAKQHDLTYKQALATYNAAKLNVPIQRATMLPTVTLTANSTYTNPHQTGQAAHNSNGYKLEIDQSLFNVSNWKSLSQAQITLKQDAITLETAKQNLITSVATSYFNILNDKDQLRYAKSNQDSLGAKLKQTQEQYNVGLATVSAVQSAKASYEGALATTISNRNTLENDYESLVVLTGKRLTDLAPLRTDFPLLKPSPAKPEAWVNAALTQNLDVITAQAQTAVDQAGIGVAKSGYWPTLGAVGSYSKTHTDPSILGSPSATVSSTVGSIALEYDAYTGGSTHYGIKAAQYTLQSDQYALENTKRTTASSMRKAYLSIVSDISQIKAYKQAVISAESALKATEAAYRVGTTTIIDLLQKQSDLFQNQQQYANAVYSYITDTLTLKQTVGTLNSEDITNINTWLNNELASTPTTSTPMSATKLKKS